MTIKLYQNDLFRLLEMSVKIIPTIPSLKYIF